MNRYSKHTPEERRTYNREAQNRRRAAAYARLSPEEKLRRSRHYRGAQQAERARHEADTRARNAALLNWGRL